MIKGPPSGVLALEYAPDGRIFSVGRDKSLRVWSASGKQLLINDGLEVLPTRIAFVSGPGRLFAGGFDGKIRVYESGDAKAKSLVESAQLATAAP